LDEKERADGETARLGPAAEDIRAQLERIVASAAFRLSLRRAALLRFVVEETLQGRADRIKGYAVAVAVFERDETFDSQSDPVVRLEARRLRHDIDGYYADEGRLDPIRISLPKGAYVPSFTWQDRPESPPPGSGESSATPPSTVSSVAGVPGKPARQRLAAVTFGAAAALLIAIVSIVYLRFSQPTEEVVGPAILVLPFDSLSDDTEDHNLASGLTYEVIADLMRFAHFRVYSVPASFRLDPGADPQALGRDLGVAYVVKGALSSGGDQIRLVAQLYDATSGRIVWSDS
jgi:TolB-like protein